MNEPLYEISKEFTEAIEKYVSATTDEELAELETTLTALDAQFKDKVVAISRYIRNLEIHISSIKAEEERLKAMRKRDEQREKWLRNYILVHMKRTGTEKISAPVFNISIRKNPPSVQILDESLIPPEYKRTVVSIEIDKAKILELHKKGIGVDGTKVEQGERLSIS